MATARFGISTFLVLVGNLFKGDVIESSNFVLVGMALDVTHKIFKF